MLKLGILGHPLSHSLSPQLHALFLQQAGLKGSYERFDIPPESLTAWVEALPDLRLNGFNVTIPHKIAIQNHLVEMTEEAEIIGAVNTVQVTPQGLSGHNTDAYGFMAPLRDEQRLKLNGATVVVLGSGGASRAVTYSLIKLGVRHIAYVIRNPDKLRSAQVMCDTISMALNLPIQHSVITDLPELNAILMDTQAVVNTTPVGMTPHSNNTPLSKSYLQQLPSDALVYDLVYNPLQTCLLKESAELGLIAQDGLDMLVYQGVKAFEIWTNTPLSSETVALAKSQLVSHDTSSR